jgi:ribonuclease T2
MPGMLRQVRSALLVGLILLFGGRAFADDTYVLALSWQPGFCAGRAGRADCRVASQESLHLTLHGLWPEWDQNGDGKRNGEDDFCVSGDFNRKIIVRQDSGNWLTLPPVGLPLFDSYVLEEAMPGTVVGLDRHEWWKHGTCSGLGAENYFATSVALLRDVERSSLARLLTDKAGATIKRRLLLDAFEDDFGRGSARALALDCSKGDEGASALMEIRIRLKRGAVTRPLTADSLAIPAKPMRGDCATEVRIPGWQG